MGWALSGGFGRARAGGQGSQSEALDAMNMSWLCVFGFDGPGSSHVFRPVGVCWEDGVIVTAQICSHKGRWGGRMEGLDLLMMSRMSLSPWNGSRRLTDMCTVVWAHGGSCEDPGGADGL